MVAERKVAEFFSEYFYAGLAADDAYRQALLNMIRTKDVNHPRVRGSFSISKWGDKDRLKASS